MLRDFIFRVETKDVGTQSERIKLVAWKGYTDTTIFCFELSKTDAQQLKNQLETALSKVQPAWLKEQTEYLQLLADKYEGNGSKLVYLIQMARNEYGWNISESKEFIDNHIKL